MLYNHHHYLYPKYFIIPTENSVLSKQLHTPHLYLPFGPWAEHSFKLQSGFGAFPFPWQWESGDAAAHSSPCRLSARPPAPTATEATRWSLGPSGTKGGHGVWVSVLSSGMARIFWLRWSEEASARWEHGHSGVCSLGGASLNASHHEALNLNLAGVVQWIEHRPMNQVGACRK